MKLKRLIVLAFAVLMALCFVACGGDPVETEPGGDNGPVYVDGDLEFTSNGDGTCYVSGIGEQATATHVIVPEKSPAGDKVTGIGNWAFGTMGVDILAPTIMEATAFEKEILNPIKAAKDGAWYANKIMLYYTKEEI